MASLIKKSFWKKVTIEQNDSFQMKKWLINRSGLDLIRPCTIQLYWLFLGIFFLSFLVCHSAKNRFFERSILRRNFETQRTSKENCQTKKKSKNKKANYVIRSVKHMYYIFRICQDWFFFNSISKSMSSLTFISCHTFRRFLPNHCCLQLGVFHHQCISIMPFTLACQIWNLNPVP